MRDEPDARVAVPNYSLIRSHKRCWWIQTAGRWSWKSKSAKECVTTHLPNPVALKMDGAEANDLNSAVGANAMLQRVGGRGGCDEGSCESAA